jgi:hypothetical protein
MRLVAQHDALKNANPKPDEKYLKAEMETLVEAVLIAPIPTWTRPWRTVKSDEGSRAMPEKGV